MTPLGAVGGLWTIFAAYWILASFGRNPAQRRENPVARLIHLLFMAATFVLLYSRDPTFGWLNNRFAPATPWLVALGLALTATGIAFAIWARWHLGKEWSADVTIRQGHRLIRTGPYARIRHPIYTGILVGMLGTALVIGEFRGLAAVALTLFGFWRKARAEESFLRQEFGADFEEHTRRTGFFLPG